MKNLENYDVQELSIKEKQETEGGFLFVFFGMVVILGVFTGWLIGSSIAED